MYSQLSNNIQTPNRPSCFDDLFFLGFDEDDLFLRERCADQAIETASQSHLENVDKVFIS